MALTLMAGSGSPTALNLINVPQTAESTKNTAHSVAMGVPGRVKSLHVRFDNVDIVSGPLCAFACQTIGGGAFFFFCSEKRAFLASQEKGFGVIDARCEM